MPSSFTKLGAVGVALLAAGLAAYIYNDRRAASEQAATAIAVAGGYPQNAPAAIVRYGCAGCHQIKGIPEAVGQSGPSLNNVAREQWVAGIMPNPLNNLVSWIVDPTALDPQTAMPRTGISEAEARDVATYLLAIR